ncbi:Hypothetical protein PHPALM_10497 [Phytophthora palmivora]|uniref:Uncharacterized protein n=1 Tax=Phytophthora palmivora TaxID=4796 RepID=A0A2P4Y4K0_9STRA|nr:Hypothetical protein PHPALM_10497 [Phytophthora palmivora]
MCETRGCFPVIGVCTCYGPFRALELVGEHAVRLEIAGTEYRLFPVVHVSKIKPVRQFPDRPKTRLTIQDQDRIDFDEALLPEDSWIRDLDNDEYEVTCDLGGGHDMDAHYVNSWFIGRGDEIVKRAGHITKE